MSDEQKTAERLKAVEEGIKECRDTIQTATAKLQELRDEHATPLCPFKVGDVVSDKHGRIAAVIAITSSAFELGYQMAGRVFDNPKNLRKRMDRLYIYDNWNHYNGMDYMAYKSTVDRALQIGGKGVRIR